MSWLYSRALAVEYLGEICLDGKRSVPSKLNPIPQAYSSSDRMMAFSCLSQFGMTFAPLMESLGAGLLTSYLEASRVRTSARQEGGRALRENALGSGRSLPESLAKYDHSSCSWKTHHCSPLGDLESFSGTWPKWGMMQSGECWVQLTLVRRTRGNGSGSWPTPNCMDALPVRSEEALKRQYDKNRPGRGKSLDVTGSGSISAAEGNVVNPNGERREEQPDRLAARAKDFDSEPCGNGICDSTSQGLSYGPAEPMGRSEPDSEPQRSDWWTTEPDVGRVAHGVAARVDRLKAIGNGQVPSVASLAWNVLSNNISLDAPIRIRSGEWTG